jgi:hypothetical protein
LRKTAIALVIVGALGTIVWGLELHQAGTSGGTISGLVIAGIGGSILAATLITFCAYVVELLAFTRTGSRDREIPTSDLDQHGS